MTDSFEQFDYGGADSFVPTMPFTDVTGGRKSPCLACARKNDDKGLCCQKCKRLFAYRLGRNYTGLPIPDNAELEEIHMPTAKPDAKEPKTTICQVPGCGKPHLARGFCSSHWSAWRHGKLPEFGEYTQAPRGGVKPKASKTESAEPAGMNQKTKTDRLAEAIEASSTVAETPNGMPPEVAVAGSLTILKKESGDVFAVIPHGVPALVLDFSHAPDLLEKVRATADNLMLPVEHVALTLIAQGLRAVEKQGDV
jgi:hypothetical protein